MQNWEIRKRLTFFIFRIRPKDDLCRTLCLSPLLMREKKLGLRNANRNPKSPMFTPYVIRLLRISGAKIGINNPKASPASLTYLLLCTLILLTHGRESPPEPHGKGEETPTIREKGAALTEKRYSGFRKKTLGLREKGAAVFPGLPPPYKILWGGGGDGGVPFIIPAQPHETEMQQE